MGLAEREKIFRVALNHFPEIGPVRWRLMLEHFGSIEAAWRAPASEYAQLPRFNARLLNEFLAFRTATDPDKLYAQVTALDLGLLFQGDPDYPELLASIYDPPFLLYWRGRADSWDRLRRSVSIVGTRQASTYGLKIARRLGEVLADEGVAVISGMALGIDAAAHEGALSSEQGLTVAVLGSGADVATPARHRRLYDRICERGLVLSELPPGFMPRTWTFPMRNRVVSGLSQAMIVVEAGLKSGTLITVDCANEQGRDVFAVPGPITSAQSKGTHALIQQGAHLLTHPDELFEALGWKPRAAQSPAEGEADIAPPAQVTALTNEEKRVYVLLSEQARHIDHLVAELAAETDSEPQQIFSLLTLLELKGLAEQLPGKLYKKKSHF